MLPKENIFKIFIWIIKQKKKRNEKEKEKKTIQFKFECEIIYPQYFLNIK